MPRTKKSSLTSSDLIKQSETLRQQADAMKAKEKPQVVASIKEAIAHYGLTAADLGLTGSAKASTPGVAKKTSSATKPGKPAKKSSKKRTAQQYRDAAGNTWSGFGPKPQWLKNALAAGTPEESLRV